MCGCGISLPSWSRFWGTAAAGHADVISIDSSFLVTIGEPVTIEQQTIYFLDEGATLRTWAIQRGVTTQEVIALMEEPEHSITTVPEPLTWAMMLIGFVGLGLMGWRAQQKVGTAHT
jgi:hypothetical protein